MTVGLVEGEELPSHSAKLVHVLLPNDHQMDEEQELYHLVEGELLVQEVEEGHLVEEEHLVEEVQVEEEHLVREAGEVGEEL